jgi:hypothetical protein
MDLSDLFVVVAGCLLMFSNSIVISNLKNIHTSSIGPVTKNRRDRLAAAPLQRLQSCCTRRTTKLSGTDRDSVNLSFRNDSVHPSYCSSLGKFNTQSMPVHAGIGQGAFMPIPEIVLLLDNAETMRTLKISARDLDWLVASGDLSPIFVHRQRKFLLSDVQSLADTRGCNSPAVDSDSPL